jgi:hypothetical protein
MPKKESNIVKNNSFGASGFTLGIVSILSLGIIGIVMSAVGFFFCLMQQTKKPTKLGKAGLIICIAGLVLSIVWIIYLAPMITTALGSSFPVA